MRLRSSIVGALMLLILIGCHSPDKKQSLDRETSHLRWLLRLYTHARQRGQAPNSEQQFQQFIRSIDRAALDRTLAAANVTTIDELFISERDGQPYIILYGQRPKGVANDVLAFEQRGGGGGKRYVGYGLGIVEEVDDQRFAELIPEGSRPMK